MLIAAGAAGPGDRQAATFSRCLGRRTRRGRSRRCKAGAWGGHPRRRSRHRQRRRRCGVGPGGEQSSGRQHRPGGAPPRRPTTHSLSSLSLSAPIRSRPALAVACPTACATGASLAALADALPAVALALPYLLEGLAGGGAVWWGGASGAAAASCQPCQLCLPGGVHGVRPARPPARAPLHRPPGNQLTTPCPPPPAPCRQTSWA